MRTLLAAAVALLLVGAAHAETEQAKRDGNRVPSQLGVSETTGETRRLKSTNDGFLIVVTTVTPGSPGAATEATLSSIDGKTPSLGQVTSTNSVPVVIASDQSSVSVTGSTVSIQNVAGTSIKVDASGSTLGFNSGIDIGDVTINNTSLTVDQGSAGSEEWPVKTSSAVSTVGASQVGSWILDFNSGVDIGDVTINNASSNSAVNVQDGGNSLTVDAAQLDTDDLTFADDKVDISGSTLGFNDGTDIGDVTINNSSITVNQGSAGSEEWPVRTSSVTSSVGSSQLGTWILGFNDGIDIGDVTINNPSLTVVQDVSGNDTPKTSTHSVSGSALEVMASNTNRESSLVCNEGPELARCSGASQVTASVGQRLLVDQCFTKDGPTKPYRGALSCISTTGSPTKITVDESE